jgi:hypothetical protein
LAQLGPIGLPHLTPPAPEIIASHPQPKSRFNWMRKIPRLFWRQSTFSADRIAEKSTKRAK